MPSPQGRYFIATISLAKADIDDVTGRGRGEERWVPSALYEDNDQVVWVLGQLEIGENGFQHYQLIFAVKKKHTIVGALKLFPKWLKPHLELTRSVSAEAYVQKEESRVEGSQFEHGVPLIIQLINSLKC